MIPMKPSIAVLCGLLLSLSLQAQIIWEWNLGDDPPPISGIEFVAIPAGSFQMGSNNGESDEKSVHTVKVGAFEMGKTEVTQGQWKAVMGNNPSGFNDCGDTCPVEGVSWNDAQDFIAKLNERNDGYSYRLPTEAEWEYACRGGKENETYCGGEDVNAVANMNISKTYPVGGYNKNGLGIYDMSGNVWEWTCSEYQNPYNGAENKCNNHANDTASRVVRGGSWTNLAGRLRSADRNSLTPGYRYNDIGFRLLRTR